MFIPEMERKLIITIIQILLMPLTLDRLSLLMSILKNGISFVIFPDIAMITCMITSKKNRVQNCQTMANITLTSVVSDSFGVSASGIFTKLLTTSKIDEVKIRSLLHRKLKKKHEEIMCSIRGYHLEADQSLKALLAINHIQYLSEIRDTISKEVINRLEPYSSFIQHACSLPGIYVESATTLIFETRGVDIFVFPNVNHFIS